MQGLMFGKSMKPSMGMVNFVYGEKPEYVCVGDIVCFSRPNKTIRLIHRVIDITTFGIVYIKGDNASEIDCVPFSSIHFKIVKFRRII
jgi:uncharacterized membrane protein (UPF0127 family)